MPQPNSDLNPLARDRNGQEVWLSTQLATSQRPDHPLVEVVEIKDDVLLLRWITAQQHDISLHVDVLPETNWVVTTQLG